MAASRLVLSVSGGTQDADGPLTLSGPVDWTAGTISGSVGPTLADTGVLTLAGASQKTLDSVGLTNSGTLYRDEGLLSIDSGAVLHNLFGGVYEVRSDAATFGGSGDLENAGTHYLLLHGREGAAGGQAYGIHVEYAGFSLRSVSPNRGAPEVDRAWSQGRPDV